MVLTLGTEVPSTPADGLVNTIWVPSIKNIQKPTAAEINAGTDLSNYVTLGGWSCSPSQDSISDQRENSAQDYENPGRKKISGPSIEVIDNTNTSHSTQNAAMETLIEGAEGYFVRRYGKQTDQTFVARQCERVRGPHRHERQDGDRREQRAAQQGQFLRPRSRLGGEREGRLIDSSRTGLSSLSPVRDPLFSFPAKEHEY